MKNILFIHSSSELYGSDKSLLNIVNNLDSNEFNIYVMLPCCGPLVEKIKLNSRVKVSIYNVAILRRKNLSITGSVQYLREFVKSYRHIKKYVMDNNINIVYTNTSVVFPAAVAAKKCHVKNVWHVREIIKSKYENRVISWIVNHYADVVIVNSKATGDAILVDKEKIKIVYNAVEEISVNHSVSSNNNKYEIVVGMAGRINRWKGQKLLIEVAEIVKKHYENVKFLIAGSAYNGEEYLEEELKVLVGEKRLNGSVILLGQVNDMESFYEKLDIFVLPSIQPEPFGLVVIEAMEAGIPVIATKHGGPMEIIEDGIDGFLVDYDTPIEMADKILQLINNQELRKKIASRGKQKKRELFSIEAMVRNISNILLKL